VPPPASVRLASPPPSRHVLASAFHQILAAEKKAATQSPAPIVIEHNGSGPAVFRFELQSPGQNGPTKVAITIDPAPSEPRR
jgi:hypothetical protein